MIDANVAKETIFIKLTNDSMQPLIPNNAILHIDTLDAPDYGKIVAMKHGQSHQLIIGKLTSINGVRQLSPSNSGYASTPLSNHKIIGVVKKFGVDL